MLFQRRMTDKEWILQQLGSSQDVTLKNLNHADNNVDILYITSVTDGKILQDTVILPFYRTNESGYKTYLQSLPNQEQPKKREDLLSQVLQGYVAIFTGNQTFIIDVQKLLNTTSGNATVETVIQGPQKALSESIDTNHNMVRRRYPQASLRLIHMKVGSLSQTKVTMAYDENIANMDIVERVKDSLRTIEVDVVQAAGQLHRAINKKQRTLFPTMMITERPDRIAYNLAVGKVIILIDGTPFALIAPSVFYDFMASMEDVYHTYWTSKFIILLRYFGLAVSLLLPGLYVGLTAFNTEVVRFQLALSIAGSRIGVPYPAYLEVLAMLFMMEMLIEASVRLPKSIGQTATTVGGLILGQAAVEAGLVSNVMIIIVSAVAISNFVIPINAMAFSMRVAKYIILALTTFFGMVGLVIGSIGLIGYLTSLESFGHPYLKVFRETQSKG
ncbi:spore germination protein [Radiobacillus deserti]|uniref:Spore germination protein n=1 Tax=Radiobacillus deserti TaxID=2594883 RepID=A0A516KK50_9BACI|nr:spore germination protein [Radiobacillus deserti]QDP41769.1 spore germination protein [Radiobacillus deserti]